MKVILVSTNAGTSMGGEAIKAFQYFQYLRSTGCDAYLLTHERCRDNLSGQLEPDRVLFVEDDAMMLFLWRSRVLAGFVNLWFHVQAAKICRRFDPAETIIHYLCPISPVVPRMPPRSYRFVIGPLSGNIFYPPAFRHRVGRLSRIKQSTYKPLQVLTGLLFRDKRRAHRILVSGYERTRQALRWAGCRDTRMMDVADAGVSDRLVTHAPAVHKGRNTEFVFLGRLIDYKGLDLAIKALARADHDIVLTVFGDGPKMQEATRIAEQLNVKDRVKFEGWLPHDELTERLTKARAFVFPTLAEANGIVMQEAMMLGLPTITLNWGGPTGLATSEQAVFIEPDKEDHVLTEMAAAMNALAADAQMAQTMGAAARQVALENFTWDKVAASWQQSYDGLDKPQG